MFKLRIKPLWYTSCWINHWTKLQKTLGTRVRSHQITLSLRHDRSPLPPSLLRVNEQRHGPTEDLTRLRKVIDTTFLPTQSAMSTGVFAGDVADQSRHVKDTWVGSRGRTKLQRAHRFAATTIKKQLVGCILLFYNILCARPCGVSCHQGSRRAPGKTNPTATTPQTSQRQRQKCQQSFHQVQIRYALSLHVRNATNHERSATVKHVFF